jgi:hypothetical protein
MAKIVLPTYNPALQPTDIGRVLEQQFAGKYQLKPSSSRWIDYYVFPNEWKGATVKLKQDEQRQQTVINVRGRVPAIWARLALLAIVWFPLIYQDTIGSRPVVEDVMNALQTSQELSGIGAPASPASPPADAVPPPPPAEAGGAPPPPPPPPPPTP